MERKDAKLSGLTWFISSQESSDCQRPLKDPRLTWNATKLEVISINHKNVWTPDITYWNSVSEDTGPDSSIQASPDVFFQSRLVGLICGENSFNPSLRFPSIERIIKNF